MGETLIEKAKEFARLFIEATDEGADLFLGSLRKHGKEVDGETAWKVLLEFTYFDLHLANRIAFVQLPTERRGIFMDVLMADVRETLCTRLKGGLDPGVFRNAFLETLNARELEYSQHRVIKEENESAKGDLFWEFAKKIVTDSGSFNPVDTLTVMVISFETFKLLDRLFDIFQL